MIKVLYLIVPAEGKVMDGYITAHNNLSKTCYKEKGKVGVLCFPLRYTIEYA